MVRYHFQEELEQKHHSWIAGLPIRPYLHESSINTAFPVPLRNTTDSPCPCRRPGWPFRCADLGTRRCSLSCSVGLIPAMQVKRQSVLQLDVGIGVRDPNIT